ncbi:MAG: nucleotidyl transferase AbiEii/AbiGii toxin family protein [Fusobacterium sp.]|nr:nucleotidyl transferase AbiEii/AbiGii toxin family protein [Fusobacterium sp.]
MIESIKDLMEMKSLKDFALGGGTNLAIKYSYRVSTDIDLFSSDIVGLSQMKSIEQELKEKFNDNIEIEIENPHSENLSFIRASMINNESVIKVDIIQNIKFKNPIETIDGIRLINDLDIGALKLLSFADRGTRKDLYDLYFLQKKYGLEKLYDKLQLRNQTIDITQKENQNIFNVATFKPKEFLDKSLTSLGNFNKSKDLKQPENRVVLVGDNMNLAFPIIKERWLDKVKELADRKGLAFEETPNIRRNKGFSW